MLHWLLGHVVLGQRRFGVLDSVDAEDGEDGERDLQVGLSLAFSHERDDHLDEGAKEGSPRLEIRQENVRHYSFRSLMIESMASTRLL